MIKWFFFDAGGDMVRKILNLGVILSTFLLLITGIADNHLDPVQTTLPQPFNHQLQQSHFSGIIMTTNHNQITSVATYGQLGAQTPQVINQNTLFPIASMEKTLTAVIVAQLIREHQLTYQTTLDHFYPQIPQAQTITIRDLLNHTSGLYLAEKAPPDRCQSDQAILHFVLHNLQAQTPHQFNYSNVNFMLLAGICDQITHTSSFFQLLQQRILQPLHLTHTYASQNLPPTNNIALPMSYQRHHYHNSALNYRLIDSLLGTGNLYMSIKDMNTFQTALNQGILLPRQHLHRLVKSPTTTTSSYSGGYYNVQGVRTVIGQYEDLPQGYCTIYKTTTDHQKSILIFSNCSQDLDLNHFANQLLRKL